MLPSRSCSIAPVRMIWLPTVCMVQPTAYMMVPTRSARPVEQMMSAISRNFFSEQPEIRATIAGVYRS